MKRNIAMRKAIQPLLTFVRFLLEKSACGRRFVRRYRAYCERRKVKAARARLQRIGWEALSRCCEMIRDESIPAYCEYGTLLGMIRERGFIRHDDDIDFGVSPASYDHRRLVSVARRYGLRFYRAFVWRGVVTEVAFTYKGVPVDFFYTYRHADGRVYGQGYNDFAVEGAKDVARTVVRVYKPDFRGIEDVEINGLKIPLPKGSEDYLLVNYGPDWRIPMEGVKGDPSRQNREFFEDWALIVTDEEDLLGMPPSLLH